MDGNFVANGLGLIVGLVIQLVPGLHEKWENWPWRLLVMYGGCFFVAFGSMVLVCYAGAPFGFPCTPLNTWAGIWNCINAGMAAAGFFGIGQAGRATIGAVRSAIRALIKAVRAGVASFRAEYRAKCGKP